MNLPTATATTANALLGMSELEIRRFSFVDAINDIIANGKPTGMYREFTTAVAIQTGIRSTGFFVPYDVMAAGRRDLSVGGDATKGGYTVATVQGDMIELLRNVSLARKLGVRFLPGLVGDLALTRQTGGATAYWLDEVGGGSTSDQTFDQVTLTPKRLFAATAFSHQLFRQTANAAEGFVRSDLMATLATEQDRVIFQGTGFSGQPRGIANTPGIQTITFGGAATYAKYIEAAKLADTTNVPVFNPHFVITPAAKEKALMIERFTGGGAAILSDDGKIGTTPADYTNQLPSNRMFYGSNFGEMVVGEWGALDITVDNVTMFGANRVKVTIEMPCDVAVRHPSGFTVSTDSAAQ